MKFFSSIISKFRHIGTRTGAKRPAHSTDRANLRATRNVLPHLTPRECVRLYQLWREGKYADPQIVFDELEEYDETLGTVVDNRQSALGEMDWDVLILSKAVGDSAELGSLAEAQQQFVTAALQRVENLDEALLHLGMAKFRGYSHLEIYPTAEGEKWLPIAPWFLARPERGGAWFYNEMADSSPANVESMDMERVIYMECHRPIDIAAMFLICAKANAVTNWDGFLERFGDPSLILKTPPNTTDEQMQAFADMLRSFVGAGTGVVPAGSEFETIETRQTSNEHFSTRAEWCDKAIVRRATGGMLTVLAESGTGTLAGSAHAETFARLAGADAKAVAAAVTRQYVKRLVAAKFPGKPCLVYFSLAAPESEDENAEVDKVVKLAGAGYHASEEEVSERVGMTVTYTAPAPAAPAGGLMMNAADTLPKRSEAPAEPPLTPEELAAFAACAKPNRDRMNQRRAEVESRLRAAADIETSPVVNSAVEDITALLKKEDEELEETGLVTNSENPCEAKNPPECPFHAGFEHPQVGNTGTAETLGLPKFSSPLLKGDMATPRIKSKLSDKLLRGGIQVKTIDGDTVTFNGEVPDHWLGLDGSEKKKKWQRDKRYNRLEDALRACILPHEIWEHHGRKVYVRKYRTPDGTAFTMAGVIKENGVARTYYWDSPEEMEQARQGKLLYCRSCK